MNLADEVKKHWLGGVVILGAACVASTWLVANEVLLKPRDFTIERQKTDLADLRQKLKDLQDEKGK